MVGWCIANRQSRLEENVTEEEARRKNPLLPATRLQLVLPLISRGQAIGAMTIQSAQPAAFQAEDITTLQTMADQLANAIENARLFSESNEPRRRWPSTPDSWKRRPPSWIPWSRTCR